MFSLRICAKGIVKSVLCIMNGFCIALAVFLMGVCLTDIQIVRRYSEDAGGDDGGAGVGGAMGVVVASTVVLTAGVALVCIAGFGCVGAIKENSRFLYLYIVMLVALVAMELMLAVVATVQRYGLELRVVEWLRDDFYRNVTSQQAEEHRRQWDRLQDTFMCCGVDGPEDYAALGMPVSLSCCRTAFALKTHHGRQQHYELCLKNHSFEKDGCENEVLYALRDSGDTLLSIAVIALLFEGSGMMLAMWLTNYLRNEVKVYKETLRY